VRKENVSSTHDAVVEFHPGLSHADKLQTFARTYDVELNEDCRTMDNYCLISLASSGRHSQIILTIRNLAHHLCSIKLSFGIVHVGAQGSN